MAGLAGYSIFGLLAISANLGARSMHCPHRRERARPYFIEQCFRRYGSTLMMPLSTRLIGELSFAVLTISS